MFTLKNSLRQLFICYVNLRWNAHLETVVLLLMSLRLRSLYYYYYMHLYILIVIYSMCVLSTLAQRERAQPYASIVR